MMKSNVRLNTRTGSKHKHLTAEDRADIQEGLDQGLTFKEIAYHLHRDPSTIAKEVKRNRLLREASTFNDPPNNCKFVKTCRRQNLCARKHCRKFCKNCNCTSHCSDYVPYVCKTHERAPFVCNGCMSKKRCSADRYFYRAITAQKRYQETLVAARQGLNITESRVTQLDDLLTPLIKKSQSVNHIYGTHREALGISKRTFYTYCDLSLFTFRNIDLPRKVRYKPRRKKRKTLQDQSYRIGRKYSDFTAYVEANPDVSVVEMDVVETVLREKVFLTLFFRRTKLMLAFTMEHHTQKCVSEVLDRLETLLGASQFMQLFHVILTDNGSEFKHAEALEHSLNGMKRCSVYYCDPMASHQKGALEKNHGFIREYIPKSTSASFCDQTMTTCMVNHINSIIRDSLNQKTPYDLAELLMPTKTLELLGLQRIEPDSVVRNPSIFIL